jgi:O-antigen ligase
VVASVRKKDWFLRELLPVIIANLGVWLPTVTIIYTLPTVLQLPLENLVLCFFTLMLAHMSQTNAEHDAS